MRARFITSLFLLLSGLAPVYAGNGWSEVAYPLSGPPQVIGSHAAGCIAGAVALPLVGDGYQVMRPSRNRYYGHPLLVRFVERLGRQAAARGGRLLVGDLGQPRGGPMPNGHRSHQSGLDVDVWFLQQPRDRVLSRPDTERIEMPTMVRAAEGAMHHSRWAPQLSGHVTVGGTVAGSRADFRQSDHQAGTVLRRSGPWLAEQDPALVGPRCPFPRSAGLPARFRAVQTAEAVSARRWLRYRSGQLGQGHSPGGHLPETVPETRTALGGPAAGGLRCGALQSDGMGKVNRLFGWSDSLGTAFIFKPHFVV